jgi:acyl-[acyl-carrier-protein]-phospholipid O-acyltransferase/long-chain-fatty-acid--[acyl-carrier-protein] ligase
MIRICRRALFRRKLSDSTGAQVTGGQLLMRALILRRLLLRELLAPDEQHVGVLLPPLVGGVIVNAAIALARRVSANLNYSATSEIINSCIRCAGIRHVLTSRRVMEKFDLSLDAELVFLEDLRPKVTVVDKLIAAFQAYLLPAGLLDRQFDLEKIQADDVLTVIFTSGSTGIPKGVMLTQQNVASNVQAIEEIVHPRRTDVILGILPFFHSFGYTVTLWGPLGIDLGAAYHFTPLDARVIGKLSSESNATILLATPTFLRSYVKRCAPEDFATLDVVVAGAEKLPIALSDAFEQKFGVRPVEGYGATELSPLVSVNVPPSRSKRRQGEVDLKEGTVGRPIPGVSAKIVHPETSEELSADEPGMLLITGPNVMKGYLGQGEKTAEVIRDGWYVTGDIATLDADGFITITGRLSRFSKIGGEMVPHLLIEEALLDVLAGKNHDELFVVVTSVPDERKGERLVVVHKPLEKSAAEMHDGLAAAGLPPLWIPARDSFLEVEEIPVLGSGKIDLKAVADLARTRLADR